MAIDKIVNSDDDSIDIEEQLLKDTLSTVIYIHENSTDRHDLSWINEHLHIMAEHIDRMKVGTSSAKNFMDMDQIEEEMLSLQNRFDDSDRQKLISLLKNIKAEKELIEQKKNEFASVGIKLKIFRAYPTSVMSKIGKIDYTRKALVGSTETDAKKLHKIYSNKFIFPVDIALGLNEIPIKLTRGALLTVAKMAAQCESYEMAEERLKEFTKISIGDDTIRKATTLLGKIVHENDMNNADVIWNELNTGRLQFQNHTKKHILYFQIDGSMLALREKDGEKINGIKGSEYHECKLVMAFSSDNMTTRIRSDGKTQNIICKREYGAIVGGVEPFYKLVLALAIRNNYGVYHKTVLISDGATWIRSLKQMLFPDCVHILDFYHLKEHIAECGKTVFANDPEKSNQWSEEIANLMKSSDTCNALKRIKDVENKKDPDTTNKLIQYIQNNINSVDYAFYQSQNYCIGSGAIESGNKSVIQRRLKCNSMRWNRDSCQALTSLRTKLYSKLWDADVIPAANSIYHKQVPVN
jgi:hypothetical protein